MYFLLNYKQYIRLLYTIESANTKKIPRIKVLSNTRDYIYRYFFVLTTNNNAITCATHTTAMMIRAIGIFLER